MERGKLPVTNYFYPRPPRGGRRSACRRKLRCCPISIHALREEGDARCCRARSFLAGFLSTPSARRATCTSGRSYPDSAISIHALREGDNCSSLAAAMTGRISIHALREEGDQNLTHPRAAVQISIHALREEGDEGIPERRLPGSHFYPRPPRGGRPKLDVIRVQPYKFLSTPSARRATFYRPGRYLPGMISIHALREEGDP